MSRLVQGYGVWTSVEGVGREVDTFTCCHCNVVVFLKPSTPLEEVGGFCRLCMRPVCPACTSKGCVPFEKKLEQIEAGDRLWAAVTR